VFRVPESGHGAPKVIADGAVETGNQLFQEIDSSIRFEAQR
jgi:hypothetical protein